MALWSTAFQNNLPDSSFLYIEPGGKKDGEGKTTPRTLRHFPYRDASGKIDLPHLRNALARIPQSSLPADIKARLTAKAQKLLKSATASADVLMFGEVGYAPLDEVSVRDMLANAQGPVRLTLNSPGGDAFVGEAIRQMLASSSVRTEITIAGVAASAAANLAMGASHVRITSNSVLMIHRASAAVYGNAQALRGRLQLLDAIDSGLVEMYAQRMGVSLEEAGAILDGPDGKGTWFTADEAKAAGLVHEVVPALPVAALAPEEVPPRIRAVLDAPVAVGQTDDMSYPVTLLAKLGLADDASEEQVLAALDRALAKPAPAPAAPAEEIAKIVRETLAAERAAAAAQSTPAVQASAHASAVSAAVERFISEGKIAPSGREQAIKACGETAVSLSAAVAYWESAPKVVPTAQRMPAAGDAPKLSAFERRMLEATGIKESDYLAQPSLKRGDR